MGREGFFGDESYAEDGRGNDNDDDGGAGASVRKMMLMMPCGRRSDGRTNVDEDRGSDGQTCCPTPTLLLQVKNTVGDIQSALCFLWSGREFTVRPCL